MNEEALIALWDRVDAVAYHARLLGKTRLQADIRTPLMLAIEEMNNRIDRAARRAAARGEEGHFASVAAAVARDENAAALALSTAASAQQMGDTALARGLIKVAEELWQIQRDLDALAKEDRARCALSDALLRFSRPESDQ